MIDSLSAPAFTRESSEYLRPRSSMDGHAPPRRSMSLNMDALHHEDMARAVSTPHTNSRSPSHTTDRSVDRWAL